MQTRSRSRTRTQSRRSIFQIFSTECAQAHVLFFFSAWPFFLKQQQQHPSKVMKWRILCAEAREEKRQPKISNSNESETISFNIAIDWIGFAHAFPLAYTDRQTDRRICALIAQELIGCTNDFSGEFSWWRSWWCCCCCRCNCSLNELNLISKKEVNNTVLSTHYLCKAMEKSIGEWVCVFV